MWKELNANPMWHRHIMWMRQGGYLNLAVMKYHPTKRRIRKIPKHTKRKGIKETMARRDLREIGWYHKVNKMRESAAAVGHPIKINVNIF